MSVRSVDIAVCTWNRAGLLQKTLESFARLSIPDGLEWRVIVVDNNSTDGTARTLAAFAGVIPLRVECEPVQGHTFARNRAIGVSNADLVAWTDDDVLVDPGWIRELVATARSHPEAAFLGGPIEVLFPDGMPGWIGENRGTLRGCFAERDLGDLPVPLTADRLPYGANFAVRGEWQKRFPFATHLGRRGKKVLGEDELEMMRRMIAAGATGRWVPGARVTHCIPADRATTGYVRDYFVGQGRALVARGTPWTRSTTRLLVSEHWHRCLYGLSRRLAPSPLWLGHLARSALARGQRIELLSGPEGGPKQGR